jgi:Rrf2 family protein
MRLTKKSEYALRAMIALAGSTPASLTISQIAEAQEIPKKFLEQILLALKSAGLVVSRAGPRGGYELARPAQHVTAGMILRAVEEPLSRAGDDITEEASGTESAIESLVQDIRQYVRTRIENVSLRELAAENHAAERVEALMWYI